MPSRDSLVIWTEDRARAAVADLATDPYVRSARLLGYSLRSQVRGFFHDPRHPAARRLLLLWFELAFEAGADRAYEFAQAIEHTWLHSGEKVLAGAWRALCKEYEGELDVAAAAGALAPEGRPGSALRADARERAFAGWIEALRAR